MITVLRLGHRIARDKRITTHVALVARAFGADKIFITTKDIKVEDSVNLISKKFGGTFSIESGVNQNDILKNWNGTIVHLTMYGERVDEAIPKFNKKNDLLIIVGAEKVPINIYEQADYNISIGNQPHSEIAALAIFLDRYTKGLWTDKKFDGEVEIIPTNKGKNVIAHNR